MVATDSAAVVADEINAAQTIFARLYLQIDPTSLDRPVRYGSPDAIETTIGWMAKQAVHETEHHLADICENLRTQIPA